MLRMMAAAHPNQLDSSILASAKLNPELARAAEAVGIPFYEVEPPQLTIYKHLFHDINPQVVYFFGRIRTIGWILAAKASGVPCLIGAERSSAASFRDRLARTADRRLLSGYITNSRIGAQNLVQNSGIPSSSVHVIPNGIEQNHLEPRSAIERSPSAPTLICVANIRPNKGQMILLHAASLLRDEFPGIKVRLLGKDFTRGKFTRQATALGLADLVDLVGFSPNVDAELDRADVFVLPSTMREGTPTSILEAMQIGLPVVASDIGGVSEIVQDRETGLLFAPNNPTDLACQLRWLFQNPERARAMASRAREFVRKNHSIESMVSAHVRVFGKLLS